MIKQNDSNFKFTTHIGLGLSLSLLIAASLLENIVLRLFIGVFPLISAFILGYSKGYLVAAAESNKLLGTMFAAISQQNALNDTEQLNAVQGDQNIPNA